MHAQVLAGKTPLIELFLYFTSFFCLLYLYILEKKTREIQFQIQFHEILVSCLFTLATGMSRIFPQVFMRWHRHSKSSAWSEIGCFFRPTRSCSQQRWRMVSWTISSLPYNRKKRAKIIKIGVIIDPLLTGFLKKLVKP